MSRWLLCLVALLGACHREVPEPEPPPVEVHCVHPELGDIDEFVSIRGRIQPPPGGTLLVASQVAGRVIQLLAHEGQRLSPGDIVAVVDDTAVRDAVRQAEAVVIQTKAAMTNADALLGRTRALVDRGIAAHQELEDAQAKAASAHASVAASNAAADLARRTLGRVQVRSGLAGVVTHVLRGPGAIVDGTASTPVLELAASSTLEFVGAMTQLDLLRVHPGQKATGHLIGTSGSLDGVVCAMPNAIDTNTGLGTVRVALEHVPASSPVGAYGQVQVAVQHHHNTMLLPATALRGAMVDGPDIVLCKDGKAHIRPMQAGAYNAQKVQVLAGLDLSEFVATDHVLGLSNDTPIRQLQ